MTKITKKPRINVQILREENIPADLREMLLSVKENGEYDKKSRKQMLRRKIS